MDESKQKIALFIDADNAPANENLPKWATGLSGSIKKVNGEWIADAPTGKVKIKFVDDNKFGILDHEVVLETGVKIYNPMRVIANGNGSEIFFYVDSSTGNVR